MRIAYIANYAGEEVARARGLVRNRALAANHKVATIAQLIAEAGHEVAIYSPCYVSERKWNWHPASVGRAGSDSSIPVFYSGAWDAPYVNQLQAVASLWRMVSKAYQEKPFDAVLLYNAILPESMVAMALKKRYGVPLIFEYEDDPSAMPGGQRNWKNRIWQFQLQRLRKHVDAVMGVSPELLTQFPAARNVLLRGVLAADLSGVRPLRQADFKHHTVMFAGSLSQAKGVEALCEAWSLGGFDGARLCIYGAGPELNRLQSKYGSDSISFKGVVSRSRLIDAFGEATVLVNPHCGGQVQHGGIFPFKLIEYLSTGRPIVSTPVASLESELRAGICFADGETPHQLAGALHRVMNDYPDWRSQAQHSSAAAWRAYGPDTVRQKMSRLVFETVQVGAQ